MDDGVLIDVSETAKETGIIYDTAITHRLWVDYVTPDDRSRPYGQSESGRLWDVVYLLSVAARSGGETVHYTVSFIMKERQRRNVQLKAVCGPGDDMTPVITIHATGRGLTHECDNSISLREVQQKARRR